MTPNSKKETKENKMTEEQELLSIIDTIRKTGNLKPIPVLFKILVTSKSETVQNEITHLLFDIKDPKIIPYLFEAINNPIYQDFQRLLVSVCWESGINYSEHLKFFVDLAVKTDYLTTIECLTVIENMDGPFDLTILEECIEIAKNEADEQESKFELLNSIWEVLIDFKQ